MAESADALVLNLGTLWPEQVEAMLMAGRRANQRGIPIVLDPVGAGATEFRTDSAQRLLRELSISIVRGNLAELSVLAGLNARISGVEAIDASQDAEAIALAFTRRHGCVAALTGVMDIVTDGKRVLRA
jgi:hydroxyethylthiazole kinase